MHWVVDGNNVFGSRPDGWWRDRAGAARRLVDGLTRWQAGHRDPVDVVFDGRRPSWVDRIDPGGVGVEFAGHADDRIVALATELAASGTDVRVVTSDRGLRARLPSTVDVMGAGRFVGLLDR